MKKTFKGALLSLSLGASCLLSGSAVFAADAISSAVKIEKSGSFKLDQQLKATILHYNKDWQGRSQDSLSVKDGYPRSKSGTFEISGLFNTADSSSFDFDQKIIPTGKDSFHYSVKLNAEQPVQSKSLSLAFSLPGGLPGLLSIDGKEIDMPVNQEKKTIFNEKAKTVVLKIYSCDVTITGSFNAFVQGGFSDGIYSLRLSPENVQKDGISKWELELDFAINQYGDRQLQLPMNKAFNMSFKDEVAGDGKGGWTDQGPQQDLSSLKPGKLSAYDVNFDIVDPDKNGGKSCLVLAANRPEFQKSATVEIKDSGKAFRYIYLLSASAWTVGAQLTGKMIAEYADGSKKEIEVLGGRDCGNWWNPNYLANAAIAWESACNGTPIGLYIAAFPIGKVPARLTFEAGPNNSVWMIAGVTFADRRIFVERKESIVIRASEKWVPIEFSGKTEAGSPLDFSGFADAPAGKYGPVIVDANGHFAFKNSPEKRIRFFGTNLVGNSNYLTKELAADFIDKALKQGYNSVRLHHYESGLLQKGSKDSLTFDETALDQYFYLISELKKSGLYICIDLYASRMLKPGDEIEECDSFTRYEMKALAPISGSAMKNWKAFAKKILTTKNPYTGLSIAEEPAVYSLNLINEGNLLQDWDTYPAFIPIYQKKYIEYLQAKNLDTPENRKMSGGLFIEFINGLQSKCIEEQKRYLRDEIKLIPLITDLNHRHNFTYAGLRMQLDFVDNHQYWDHPSFPGIRWKFPFLFNGQSSISKNAQSPRSLMPTRVFGKPFTVTEFNYCNPNPYRVEGGPLMGAYAGLQDWDGLYRFAWSHSNYAMQNMTEPRGFDSVNDPQAQMADRIIAALFLRGDVKAADSAIAFGFSPEMIRGLQGAARAAGPYPDEFSQIGLYTRIGTIAKDASFKNVQKFNFLADNWTNSLPEDVRKAMDALKNDSKITSATGELSLDSTAKTFKVVTPKTETLTFSGDASAKVLNVKNADVYQTIALISLDGKALAESRKMLLIQLTDVAGSGEILGNEKRTILESWGNLPALLQKGKADVELAVSSSMKVEALKFDGSLNGAVKADYAGGKLSFTADTSCRQGGVMAYLISK